MNNNKVNLKDVKIQITTFGVNSAEIENLSEFKRELALIYTVRHKDKPCAACGGSCEMDLLISICDKFSEFVVSGLIWDLTKGILSHLMKKITKLRKINKNLYLGVTIKFGNFQLHINEATSQDYGPLEALFKDINRSISYIHSRGFGDITNITMPFIEINDKENRFVPSNSYGRFTQYWWKVRYHKAKHTLYYKPSTKEIFLPYP